MSVLRVVVVATAVLMAGVATAHATAGAPDPSLGSHGAAPLPMRSTKAAFTTSDTVIALPSGELLVPVFKANFYVKKGRTTGVRSQVLQLLWLNSGGRVARRSKALTLPKDLYDASVHRTSDGHLLVVGARYKNAVAIRSIFIMRLSALGVPEAAPGSAAATVSIAVNAVPNIAATSSTSLNGISVSPSGRVFAMLTQASSSRVEPFNPAGSGPTIVAAFDATNGLATEFAGGSVVIAPATDSRSTSTATMTGDDMGRLYVLTQVSKRAVGGTTQDVRLARYDATGTLDATFAGGHVDIDAGSVDIGYSSAASVTVLRDGDVLTRINAVTETDAVRSAGIELARFTSAGQPSAGFGTAGRSMITLQRSKASGYNDFSLERFDQARPVVLEQSDGKLIVSVSSSTRYPESLRPGRDGVLRTTRSGALDVTYEHSGFARLDAPTSATSSVSTATGIDASDRVVGMVSSYIDEDDTRRWAVRLLGGDVPAAKSSIRMRLDNRPSCGSTAKRACFDADGRARITGMVTAGGRPVVGAAVTVTVRRPPGAATSGPVVVLAPVRSGAGGRFAIPLSTTKLLPGAWKATARVTATSQSQSLDMTRPVHFVLGPPAAIGELRRVQRAQALATILEYVIDDSMLYGDDDEAVEKQCKDLDRCFGDSEELRALVSTAVHPAPGNAGVALGRPGSYTAVARVDTTDYVLEFVVTAVNEEYEYTCRGDAAARKKWCPGGTWSNASNDPFVTVGIDGEPFDY